MNIAEHITSHTRSILLLAIGLSPYFSPMAFARSETSISRSAEAGEVIEYAFELTNNQEEEGTMLDGQTLRNESTK